MSEWKRLPQHHVESLIDFKGGDKGREATADLQIKGTTALYNRLCDRRIAWLADEVGMGKTYIALGVAALVRRQNPDARILFIVPSWRLREK